MRSIQLRRFSKHHGKKEVNEGPVTGALLDRMVREGMTEKAMFEQSSTFEFLI